MYRVLGIAAVCVVALVGTAAAAATDGRGGAAGSTRPGPEASESKKVPGRR